MRPVCNSTIEIYPDGRVRLPANFKLNNKPVSVTCNLKTREITFRQATPGEVLILKPYYAKGKRVRAASPVLSMRRIFRAALGIQPEDIAGTYKPKVVDGGLSFRWKPHETP